MNKEEKRIPEGYTTATGPLYVTEVSTVGGDNIFSFWRTLLTVRCQGCGKEFEFSCLGKIDGKLKVIHALCGDCSPETDSKIER